ncbi:MAG TPA: PHP domain-containing protein, partial [Gaiellaceae bacterium]|nr:PHP domain-containing protein [Gaiellaceae bacterium]
MTSYIELHCHSAYSFLDGASLPEELALRAAELGYPALALTDHDGVYGSLEFAHAARLLGIRAITGAEVTLEDGSHVTLLVETQRGYATLCRLLTAAHAGKRLEPRLPLMELEQAHEGLVCLSGCARSGLAHRDPNATARLARAVGPEHFFIELQRPFLRGDARRNAALRELAKTLGLRTIVTGNAHAHHPRRVQLQDVLVAIGERSSLEACEPARRGNEEVALLPPDDMVARWADDRDALQATVELAERLRFDLTQELGYRYPDFSDREDPADVQLARVCRRVFDERYRHAHALLRARADARLDEELNLIADIGLS